MLRWQQAEGRRHAYNARQTCVVPWKSFTTLCGIEATPLPKDIISLGGHWFDGTCMTCEAAWLTADAAGVQS
jgi:hypothetical protein